MKTKTLISATAIAVIVVGLGAVTFSGRNHSGLLAIQGGLVFGASGGNLFALDSGSGREVFRQSLGGTTMSPPISFAIDRAQVIAVAAGRALFVFELR